MAIPPNDKQHSGSQSSSMSATSSDLLLSASALSEFVFCPRAGILTLDSRAEDHADEPAFDVTAIYELQVLDAAIVRTFWLIVAGIAGGIVLGVASSRILQQEFLYIWFVAALVGVRLLVFVGKQFSILISLLAKRRFARKAHCPEPDRQLLELQRVTWWGLLNLGFESLSYSKALHDPEWKVIGKPWRVLRRGSLRIPAFRTRSDSGTPSPQSITKIMAYCYLLEKREGFDSPYGIVLMGNTYRGFAVPYGGGFHATFRRALREFRVVAANAELRQTDPMPPTDQRKCSACPFGKPRRVSLGILTTHHDQLLRPHVLRRWHETFHCNCGDRFRWKPPHVDNAGLGESG